MTKETKAPPSAMDTLARNTPQADVDNEWGAPIETDFMRFETPGDLVMGKLVEKSEIVIRGKLANKYKLERNDGSVVSFNGGTKIDDVLSTLPLGSLVRIQFTGKSAATTGGNRMNEFDIRSK